MLGFFPRLAAAALALTVAVSASPVMELEKRVPGRVVRAGDPVLVDRGSEYMRISFMNDNSMIGGYTTTSGNTKILKAVRSTDGAKSWQYLGEVFRGDTASHEIDNSFPMQLPNGRVLYAYRNHDIQNGQIVYFRISISYSDDGGKSYKYLSTVAEQGRSGDGATGLWEPFLRIAKDGTIQCYYSGENNAGDQDNFMKYSKDNGQTWSSFVPVSGGDRTSRDGMTGVAPIDNNGNLICVFENTENGYFSVDYVKSHNDGYSWGERGRLYTARNSGPKSAGAPQVYNVWGTLVASFITNEDVDNSGSPVYQNGQMKVITSTNGGQSWSGSVVVGNAPAQWGGLFNRDPTHFLAMYSQNGNLYTQLYELQN